MDFFKGVSICDLSLFSQNSSPNLKFLTPPLSIMLVNYSVGGIIILAIGNTSKLAKLRTWQVSIKVACLFITNHASGSFTIYDHMKHDNACMEPESHLYKEKEGGSQFSLICYQ